jgi:hypothetical protein
MGVINSRLSKQPFKTGQNASEKKTGETKQFVNCPVIEIKLPCS